MIDVLKEVIPVATTPYTVKLPVQPRPPVFDTDTDTDANLALMLSARRRRRLGRSAWITR